MTTALQVACGSWLRVLIQWTEGIPLDAACQVTRVAKNFGHGQLMHVCIKLQQRHWFDSEQDSHVVPRSGLKSASIVPAHGHLQFGTTLTFRQPPPSRLKEILLTFPGQARACCARHVRAARRIYSTEDMEPPQTHFALWAGAALVVSPARPTSTRVFLDTRGARH
jgi:hypothetical protein